MEVKRKKQRQPQKIQKKSQAQPTLGPFCAWFGSETIPVFLHALLHEPGGEVYVVGGAVRDVLLGRKEKKDLDLVVRGIRITRLVSILKKFGRVDEVGRVFGVIKFIPRGAKEAIDIALPRTEFAFGTGGYKDVTTKSRHTLPLEEDLARRDFTVNAMAWDIKNCRLIDPFGGEHDLSKKELRAVGEPELRFQEDYTRILRLCRFAIELGFTVHPSTWHAAKKLAPHIQDQRAGVWVVPRELVAKEFLKALFADPVACLSFWDDIGLWKILMKEALAMKGVPQPGMYHQEGDVWQHTVLALAVLKSRAFQKQFPDGFDAETALTVLLHDIGKPDTLRTPEQHGTDRIRFDGHDTKGSEISRAIIERLALTSYKSAKIDVDMDRVVWVVAHHLLLVSGDVKDLRPQTIEKYFLSKERPGLLLRKVMYCDIAATINQNGKPFWTSFRALEKRIKQLATHQKKTGDMPKPILDGVHIMRILKISPGPLVGNISAVLRDAQLMKKVKTIKQAELFIKRYVKEK